MGAFGAELRRLRQRSGLSQEGLAHRAGLSPEAVSLLERGRRSPRMTTMRLLADALALDQSSRTALFDAQLADDPGPGVAAPSPALSLGIPQFLDALTGRDAEVERLVGLLDRPEFRLITVTGPGGVGKTRVAAAAAQVQMSQLRYGVRWLAMTSLSDPDQVLSAVGAALGHRPIPGAGIPALVDFLADQEMLLVFDGADHLLDRLRPLVLAIAGGCPRVHIMITIAHRLHHPSEMIMVIEPLSAPAADSTLDAIAAAPAAELFRRRAHLRGDLAATELIAVARICRRLDGLPLALELAAARTEVMSVTELADTLDQTLGILSPDQEGRSLADRVVGWTFALLPVNEQELLSRMAVFGTFTHVALAEACRGRWTALEVLDMISSLLAKSLVSRVSRDGDHSRFTLLEVVREYAIERLNWAGREDARGRHARYFRDLAVAAEPHLTADDHVHWLALLDYEIGNLRRAVAWLVTHDPESALRLTGSLWRWCYLRGRYTEGRQWMQGALEASSAADPALRATALAGSGLLAFLQCDYAEAESNIAAARDLHHAARDHVRTAWCLTRLGSIARERGHYPESVRLHTQALEIVMQGGDDHAIGAELNYLSFVSWISGDLDQAEAYGRAALHKLRPKPSEELIWCLINSGTTARYRGDLDGAELLLQRALEQSQTANFREGIGWAHNQLGVVARLNGQLTTARRLQLAALSDHARVGDRWRMASVLDELAAVSAAEGDMRQVAADLGVADRLRVDIDVPVPAVEQADRAASELAARTTLGAAFHAAVLAGSIRSIAEAVS